MTARSFAPPTPAFSSSFSSRPTTARAAEKRPPIDDLDLMQPHSARVHLRNRRRAAALGEGAHTLAVHELMRRYAGQRCDGIDRQRDAKLSLPRPELADYTLELTRQALQPELRPL